MTLDVNDEPAMVKAISYVITDRDLLEQPGVHWEHHREPEPVTIETSVPGVFAAWDVRQGSIKRIASAVGEGPTVVRLLHEHLREDERVRPAN